MSRFTLGMDSARATGSSWYSSIVMPERNGACSVRVSALAIVLPPDEVNKHLQSRHEEVTREFPDTIYMWHMHQKIALIDDHLAFLGSMNMLGHKPGTRLEVMAQFQSRTLVADLMAHERTDQLASPPTCPRCVNRVNRVRVPTTRSRGTASHAAGSRPFPARPGSRNQSQP